MQRTIANMLSAAHRFLVPVAAAFLLAGCATQSSDQTALLARARTDRAHATQAALAQVPGGRVKAAELDDENGTLTWWFDILAPGAKTTTEVSVDANTGGVICVSSEIPTP